MIGEYDGRVDNLKEIDLTQFIRPGVEPGKEEPQVEPGKEIVPGEKPEIPEEEKYTEIPINVKMLIALIGYALSMRYLPDKTAVKEFSKQYQESLPKIIERLGMEELFDQVVASTLTFKIKEADILAVPLPPWIGLVAVLGVLVIAGLFIKVPTKKTPKAHKDLRKGKDGVTREYGSTDKGKGEE